MERCSQSKILKKPSYLKCGKMITLAKVCVWKWNIQVWGWCYFPKAPNKFRNRPNAQLRRTCLGRYALIKSNTHGNRVSLFQNRVLALKLFGCKPASLEFLCLSLNKSLWLQGCDAVIGQFRSRVSYGAVKTLNFPTDSYRISISVRKITITKDEWTEVRQVIAEDIQTRCFLHSGSLVYFFFCKKIPQAD
jgi:hypothetical protein